MRKRDRQRKEREEREENQKRKSSNLPIKRELKKETINETLKKLFKIKHAP